VRVALAAALLLAAGCGGSGAPPPSAALRDAAEPVAPRHAVRSAVEDIAGLSELGDARALAVIGGVSSRSRVEPYLSRLARGITGRHGVEVRCWSPRHWRPIRVALAAGALRPGSGRRAHLPAAECNRLVAFANRPTDVRGRPRIELVVAVAAFAHDLEHLAGDRAEAVVECRGMQEIDSVAGLLGAPRPLARGLAQLYWTQIYPRNPPAYRSPECRDGGSLDLDRTLDLWP
jgi:hypothetical protein